MNDFEEVKKTIEFALEEIKKKNLSLYEYLKNNIIINEEEKTFCYVGD